jgi:hypothetical protein
VLVTVLAASSVASQVYPGLVGFLVVAGMGAALYFLFRSLNKQLHKLGPAPQAGAQARSRPPRPGLAAYRAMRAQQAAQAGPGTADGGPPDQPPGSTRP